MTVSSVDNTNELRVVSDIPDHCLCRHHVENHTGLIRNRVMVRLDVDENMMCHIIKHTCGSRLYCGT